MLRVRKEYASLVPFVNRIIRAEMNTRAASGAGLWCLLLLFN